MVKEYNLARTVSWATDLGKIRVRGPADPAQGAAGPPVDEAGRPPCQDGPERVLDCDGDRSHGDSGRDLRPLHRPFLLGH